MSVDKDGKSANIDHLFDSGYCTNSGSNIDSIVKSEDTITVTDNDRLPPPESIPIPEEEEDLDAVSLLHLAISGRSSRVALQIMDLLPSPDYLDIRNELYQTPLHLAALTEQARIVRRLVLGGATIDTRDRYGDTALHIACQKGSLDLVQSLTTPLSMTEVESQTRNSKYRSRLHNISSNSWNRKMVSILHAMNYEGETCVHLAVKSCNKELIRKIVELGANINVKEGRKGWTPLHWAIHEKNNDLVNFLMYTCHADIQTFDYAGISCLQLLSPSTTSGGKSKESTEDTDSDSYYFSTDDEED